MVYASRSPYNASPVNQKTVCVAVGAVRQYACPSTAAVVVAGISSKHLPNHPFEVHVVVAVVEADVVVVVMVISVVVLSLHPNQPGCIN
jgi:hypothetical protein